MAFGEGFGILKCWVPFSCKILFNVTQLASSKKYRTSWNYQGCFCAKSMQAIVCGNRLPESVKQANKGNVDLATSVLQKARPAVSASKRNISVPRAFATAEERKRVPPQEEPLVLPNLLWITGIKPCTAISPASRGRGGLSWLLTLWPLKFSGAYTAEKPWTKPACNHSLCEH